ncbi:MAG: helix-turn-helix domain-containing protein [Flavobacteriales bacterium]|jgi:transcriptional regulator with XRE-family HTH domain
MTRNTDKELLLSVGAKIRLLRKKRGMSLKDLSYAIGMEPSNLSVIENGKSNPQLLTYAKIASALDSSLKELFTFPFDYKEMAQAPSEYKPRKHV